MCGTRARVGWRRLCRVAGEQGLDMLMLGHIGEAIFVYLDEGALRAAQLAPLERLRPAQQDRLAETLLAWLQHGCYANEVAVCVHVHPQTVRYRLRQVDDLFGDQLRDPDRRFELEIALRAQRMLQHVLPPR